MTPEQAFHLVHAYMDGEMDPASTLEFEAHLAGSPALRAEHQRLAALQSSIRRRATRYAAPPRLQDRVLAALPSLPSYKSTLGGARRWRRIAIGGGIAAAVLLAWNVKVTFMGPDSEDVLLDDVVSAHVRSLMADHITDIASADRHTVKPWLSSRLDFSPPAFDFTENGFPLVGARLDYVGRNAVAAIVYKHRQHLINVFVAHRSERPGGAVRVDQARGYNSARFDNGDMRYWLVSDLNVEDLSKLVALIQHSLESPRGN